HNPLARIDSIGAAQRKAALLVQNTTPRGLSGDARVYAAATCDLAALLFLHVQQDRPAGGHTVGAVYRLAMGGPALVREVLRSSRVAEVRERHGIFSARERRVQEAAVTGVLERLSPWADPLVGEATSHDFDLGRIPARGRGVQGRGGGPGREFSGPPAGSALGWAGPRCRLFRSRPEAGTEARPSTRTCVPGCRRRGSPAFRRARCSGGRGRPRR